MAGNFDDCEIENTTIVIEPSDCNDPEFADAPAAAAAAAAAAATDAAAATATAAAAEEEPLEVRLEKLMAFIYAQPLQREVLYRVLNFCETRRMLTEVEDFIMSRPEYNEKRLSPFFMIEDLREKNALVCIELDENGNDITETDKEGLDENEIDDLVVDFAYELTELGKLASEKTSPRARFADLTGANKEHVQAYLQVMSFLTEKRGAASIDMYLHNWKNNAGSGVNVSSGLIIDKLEKAGIINWQKGWLLTEEGKELLLELAE